LTAQPHKNIVTSPWFWAFLAVSILRLSLVLQPPVNSTDLLRNLGFGKEFWNYGFHIYDYRPMDFVGTSYADLWAEYRLIYPGMMLLFFALVAKIWPALAFGKLVLTLVEAANAYLVGRISGERWLGLIYYLNPASVWWVSREGQFEPVVVLFMLLGLLFLKRRPLWAYLALALSMQVKYLSAVLLPYFVRQQPHWSRAALGFALGLIPSFAFISQGDYILHTLRPGHLSEGCNSYAWNFLDPSKLCGSPNWLVAWNAVLTYGLLALAIFFMARQRRVTEYFGFVGYLALLKTFSWAQFWYLLVLPALALPIQHKWARRSLLALSCAEVVALHGLFIAPFGWVNPTPPVNLMWGL